METNRIENRIVLGLRKHPAQSAFAYEEWKSELMGLCDAAGGSVVGVIMQERPVVDGRTYLGTGKIEELAQCVEDERADLVIFDAELSPAQVRNIEQVVSCRVIDRTQLILDIFANRARSKAGRMQVEIAQLQYLLPRLTGQGEAMSRLGAGIGTRGPGETKLEADRRRIRDRMAKLRQDLRELARIRDVQRDKRSRSVPVVAFVGYTNAGKTTLLDRWTKDRGRGDVTPGHNRLFDTLDPLARRVRSGLTRELVLLDTVGFIQDLPHFLVDAFKSTLEEVLQADLIVHVVDGSSDAVMRMETTYEVLDKLGALRIPVLTFFNKMDKADQPPAPDVHAEETIRGSAVTGEGMARLYERVDALLQMDPVNIVVEGDPSSTRFWNLVGHHGRIVKTEPIENGLEVTLQVERRHAQWISEQFESPSSAARGWPLVSSEELPKESWISSTD